MKWQHRPLCNAEIQIVSLQWKGCVCNGTEVSLIADYVLASGLLIYTLWKDSCKYYFRVITWHFREQLRIPKLYYLVLLVHYFGTDYYVIILVQLELVQETINNAGVLQAAA